MRGEARGRLALVTGGCRRLGAYIAARLADDGHDVALHAGHDTTTEDWLPARLAAVRSGVFVADLSDPAAVAALPAEVEAKFGRPIDLLVNNASRFSALEDASGGAGAFDDVRDHVAVNLAAPVALTMAVAARAGERGCAVVNILDQRVANPPRDQLGYTLSKQALAEATRTLAASLAPRVRVNGVAPGLIIPTDDYTPDQVERLAGMMPLARLAAPADVADAVAWLASAGAVTGQVLFVDGGAHLTRFDRDFVHLGRTAP